MGSSERENSDTFNLKLSALHDILLNYHNRLF